MNEPVIFDMKLARDTDIAVGISDTVYTDAFQFGDVDYFALVYVQTATGVPNIKIEMEQSTVRPATENAADSNYFVPRTVGDIESALTSKAKQGCQLTPITVQFIRFKITEQTGVVTDTVVNMQLSLQKKFSQ